jgi:diguanylate cyclase (GGDEF)-like protein
VSAPVSLEEALRLDALEMQKITDTPPDESFDRIVRLACAATETPVGLISFVDGERQWFKARQGLEMGEIPREQAFCAHALQSPDVMVVEDTAADPRFADSPLVTGENGFRFYAGAPLRTRGGFNLGTLCVMGHVPRRMSEADKSMLADMAAIAVNQMELRKRAGTDILTGLFNRRLFDEIACHEVSRARRQNEPLTLARIDIDKFKTINDSFGHPAGDAVLRALGSAVRKALRDEDQIARFGGEEIALLLPNTGWEHAAIVLDRVRRDIMAMIVPELNGRWAVTASIGAAELQADDAGIAEMLTRADVALTRAKEAGRNRLEMAEAA